MQDGGYGLRLCSDCSKQLRWQYNAGVFLSSILSYLWLSSIGTMMTSYLFVILGLYLVLPTVVAVDAYYDESESAIAWFLIVALSGNLGLFLYIFGQREPEESDPGARSPDNEVVLPSAERDLRESDPGSRKPDNEVMLPSDNGSG